MKRVVHIKSDEVDLTVTIEGTAPAGIPRVIAREAQLVAQDFIGTVTVTHTVEAEDVPQ